MTEVLNCPSCDGRSFIPYISAKDYTVSHETFSIHQCENCKLLVTSPRPDDRDLYKYYLSDNYLSHSNKPKGIFDRIYRVTRRIAVNWKVGLIQTFRKEKISILDFGCGTGHFLKACHDQKWNITGVEPSDSARQLSSSLLNIPIHKTLDEVHDQFDVITLWHVLEHIPDLTEKFQQLLSKLKINGTIFIAVPNHKSNDAVEYKQHWAGFDVPRHLWHFNQHALQTFTQVNNSKIVAIVPMKLDAFYVSILSENYKQDQKGIQQFLRGILSGLRSNLKAKRTSEYSSLIYVVQKNA